MAAVLIFAVPPICRAQFHPGSVKTMFGALMTCPKGQVQYKGKCQACTANSSVRDGNCQCNKGYTSKNGKCVKNAAENSKAATQAAIAAASKTSAKTPPAPPPAVNCKDANTNWLSYAIGKKVVTAHPTTTGACANGVLVYNTMCAIVSTDTVKYDNIRNTFVLCYNEAAKAEAKRNAEKEFVEFVTGQTAKDAYSGNVQSSKVKTAPCDIIKNPCCDIFVKPNKFQSRYGKSFFCLWGQPQWVYPKLTKPTESPKYSIFGAKGKLAFPSTSSEYAQILKELSAGEIANAKYLSSIHKQPAKTKIRERRDIVCFNDPPPGSEKGRVAHRGKNSNKVRNHTTSCYLDGLLMEQAFVPATGGCFVPSKRQSCSNALEREEICNRYGKTWGSYLAEVVQNETRASGLNSSYDPQHIWTDAAFGDPYSGLEGYYDGMARKCAEGKASGGACTLAWAGTVLSGTLKSVSKSAENCGACRCQSVYDKRTRKYSTECCARRGPNGCQLGCEAACTDFFCQTAAAFIEMRNPFASAGGGASKLAGACANIMGGYTGTNTFGSSSVWRKLLMGGGTMNDLFQDLAENYAQSMAGCLARNTNAATVTRCMDENNPFK